MMANAPGVALVAEAAHRYCREVVEHLATEGLWVAAGAKVLMKSRVKQAQALGSRAIALQMDVNDSTSVRRAVDQVEEQLGAINLLVHIAPDHLIGPPERIDACTELVVASMERRGGVVVFLLGADDAFPDGPARSLQAKGIHLIGIRLGPKSKPSRAGEALVEAWRDPMAMSAQVRPLE